MRKAYSLLLVLVLVFGVAIFASCGSVVQREVNLGDIPASEIEKKVEVVKEQPPKTEEVDESVEDKIVEEKKEEIISEPVEQKPASIQSDTPFFAAVSSAERMGSSTKLNWTHNGATQNFGNFGGKVYLIDVWAEWCPPCKGSTPTLIDLHNKYADKGLVVIGINIDTSSNVPSAKDYSEEHGIPYPILWDSQGYAVGGKFVQDGIPNFTLVDSQGKILKEHTGMLSSGSPGLTEIERLIKQALGL